ncbi:hypothetical protein EYF80_007065 [Liparis tanakae]|uniref:Uncharacterized protein n=1 Tax=Liparis tanakae TaxID=230148 RepID=A0A4Z2IXQ0_9TELE|nr:hypothetical protein EYF80_007065 [Liparis tanakae]
MEMTRLVAQFTADTTDTALPLIPMGKISLSTTAPSSSPAVRRDSSPTHWLVRFVWLCSVKAPSAASDTPIATAPPHKKLLGPTLSTSSTAGMVPTTLTTPKPVEAKVAAASLSKPTLRRSGEANTKVTPVSRRERKLALVLNTSKKLCSDSSFSPVLIRASTILACSTFPRLTRKRGLGGRKTRTLICSSAGTMTSPNVYVQPWGSVAKA